MMDVRQLHGVIAALTHESKQDKDLRVAANALVARFVRDLKKKRGRRMTIATDC